MSRARISRRNAATLFKLFAVCLLWERSFAQQVYNLSLSIEEGLPARTIVGDIRAGLQTPSSGFFISESRDSYVFKDLEIDADTGIISTAVVLDRESRDQYEFVAATLTGDVIKVKIVVKDVNDHSPVFSTEKVELNVSELSPPGTRFEFEGAKDQDDGEFGTRGYRITESEMGNIFMVKYREGVGNLFNLDLILTDKLDRETRDLYSLTIEAFDGGIPPKTGLLKVYIHVSDENDNPPVFNQTEYQASVWEDALVMSPVCQVYATDLDLGDNGLVTYEINRRQSDPNEFFVINGTSGVIHVNKPLDFETQPFHELIVRARDNGAQPEYSSTFVAFRVLDINDNSPIINVLFLSETGEAEVSEGAGMGEYVARISVSDPDLGEVGKLRVTLEGGDGKFTLKQTDDFLYALCVDGELDREKEGLYELKVVASDFGSPPLKSESTLLVRVTDTNDWRPVFDQDVYTVSVSEDVPQGSSLLSVQARDSDDGVNAAILYSILQSDQDHLVNVDPESGLITTAARLDRERETEVRFLMVAVDGGSPALSSTATITVMVEDVNDNEPVFQQQLYNVSIPEHTQIGNCFLQVVATDVDGRDFGTVRYSISDGFDKQDTHPLFQINPDSGELCISQDIDRDSGLATYDLLVKAEDQGGLSAQTYVHIEVDDLNDNPPVFNPEKYVTSVSSHAQPGTEVLSVIATDRDSGDYGHVTYQILARDLSSLFSVDKTTGVVYLTSTLTHLGTASIKLAITAQDSEGVTSARPAEVTVNVLRSAQAPAVFQRSRYAFTVPENALPGTPVGIVEALNPANSVDSLSYRISSGDPHGLFSVHSSSGLISTSHPLDHESQPYALLVLQCHAGTASPVYSSTQVNVTIADINDNAPVFPKMADTVAVSQNTPPGTVLFIAHAHDADSGVNGRVRYFLSRGSARGSVPFYVDADQGTVYLNQSFSRDPRPKYTFEILAKDMGEPSLTASLMLTVNVARSATEDTLAFETLVYQVEMGEGTQIDTRVIQVRAHRSRGSSSHQQGSNPNPVLSYSLEPDPDFPPPPLRVHPASGWLFLSQNLDYETEPMFRFKVLATVQDETTLAMANTTATTNVIVLVLDENDNAPVFTSLAYFFTVQEGPLPQGLVGTVQAVDRDSRKNAQLSYILLSDGKHFRINTKTGEIINWVSLDREQHAGHTLKVMVTDQGQPRLNATATIHILVTDINDNPPQFTHLPASGKELNVQVWAGLPTGSLVTTMFAKDLDAGENATVRFSLTIDEEQGHFEIDSQSGEILSTELFTQNAKTQYTLTVVATDNGAIPLEETAVIHLQVQAAEKQHGGTHPQSVRLFSVREDTKPGTVIGSVHLSPSPTTNGRLRYSITEGDGVLHFGLDSSSGDLYLNQPLDYESTARYFLVVHGEDATRPGMNVTAFVSVAVEDVNDHVPWFPCEVITLGLLEDVEVGTRVIAFNAKDGDGSLANSALRYSLTFDPELGRSGGSSLSSTTSSFPFRIHPLTGTLTTTTPLDRERTVSFTFMVTATDQAARAVDRKFATVTAQVFLLDVNDNRPAFISHDTVLVMEDAEVGSLVHRVVGVDDDVGESGQVTYCLVSGNKEGFFTLEEKTGLLYLASPLDYELQTSHSLTIQASDQGLPSLSSIQTLMLEVGDVNDQPPLFQQDVYTASVAENREPGESVVTVSATDKDSEENAAVWYSLLPGPGYDFFSIDPHSGEMSTTSQLDRELHQHFTLRVQARDSGVQPLSSTSTVLCSVLDDNDNVPEFMQASFQLSLPENLPPGVIHTSQASDPDHGANGTITYAIQGEDYGGRFTIHATTGAVSTTRALDREERPSYTLCIQASDGGQPSPLSSSTQLLVLLLDQNDNSPSFHRKSYRASLAEGLPAGAEVLRLEARDPDQGPNGEVTFSLAEDTLGAFSVEPATGVIRTTRPLDRESRAQYTFRAVATDGCARGPRSSATAVTVQVEDANDNAPVCTENPIVGWVTVETIPNKIVATVTAVDGDRGENGTVWFSLVENNPFFTINGKSGDIRLNGSISQSFLGANLQVLAADQGRPALTSTCLVLIHLKGEDEPLHFTETLYEAVVVENSKTGTWVGNVVAHDRTDDRRRIEYSIFNGNENGAFAINRHTGDITVWDQASLDYEANRRFHLVVLADGGPLHTAHCRVTVTQQDVNDNAPAFEQGHYRTAVWEGQVHNTYVMQVFASDADRGVNGQIEYSILSGNQNEAFIIDSVRGILVTNTVLDREITSSYKLVLQASDRGSPPLSSTATVRVQVVDINDNSPAIPPMEPVVIAENLPVGYMVTQVSANDVDLSSTVTYSFLDNASAAGSFAIDRYTGVVTLTQKLDHEEQTTHRLVVWASDSLHQTTAEVLVQVLDVNDNVPVFSQDFYQVKLPELSPANMLILTVAATDRDSGLNGKLGYRLLSSTLHGFYIHPDNGSVFTNKPLKYVSNGNVIQLLVEARDWGDPVRSTVTSVDIVVLDANDHTPLFQHDAYTVSPPEDTPVGTTLLTLWAEDLDWEYENTNLDFVIASGNEDRKFCIEVGAVQTESQQRTAGSLVLCQLLDRETTEGYILTVIVSDRGSPPLNSSAVVAVTVADVNDNVPAFVSAEYHAQASESSPAGTRLVQVTAQDPDRGTNGLVRYDIISGNSKGHLRLDPHTGTLEVNHSLDYEEDSKYALTVQASDGGEPGNRKVAFTVVFVMVLDENDNSPYFIFPVVNCSVPENLPAFTPTCSVHAIDQDAGPYGQLTYSIMSSCFMDYGSGSPDRKEAFAIDNLTGDIHTRQTFDFERESDYCFIVEARDKGEQAATVRVQVAIEGADEFSPVFTQRQYRFILPENAKAGQTVGHVMAMDHDGGLDGMVEYSLVNPSQLFSINKTTGAVFVSGPVYRKRGSFSNEDVVELLVTAGSPRMDSRSTTSLVTVNISNSAEALVGVALGVQTVTLGVSLAIFLLLLVSFVALVLRYKTKEAAIKKAAALAANLNTGTFGRTGGAQQRIGLRELRAPITIRVKREISFPIRNSDSSGRGSAEGETAEDHEIKMINEYPCRKRADSAQSRRVPDSGVPKDSDQLSCHSEDENPGTVVTTVSSTCLATGMQSSESLHTFKEEGGGEGMLPRVRMRDMEESMRGYVPLSDSQASVDGSFSSLLCPEEQLRGSYGWDYLLDWEPRYHTLASVFTDISLLPDEDLQGGNEGLASEACCLMHPPPLITGVAQPGLRAVPPRMPLRSMHTLTRRPSYPKYAYAPLARNTGLTPSAMTPSFSPSLSVLTLRTPNASPVVSETGLGVFRLDAGSLLEGEIQV
ncbi:protocadherin-23 [Salvelinus sp. IW2-2015]|uniref:protocadherin-23 n=1 Tax=Salvelinus sp. IW2-2015 TaxID=2691554 RepID=UPI000CDF64D5|nr:protocadherin-23 [Salvelinus alpinus]